MKPEEQVEIMLWDWLKTKGTYIKEIYFNRKNELGNKIFTTSGINKKPDFVIAINRGYGIEYIAVEIKSSKTDREILNSNKIIDYYLNYSQGKTKYYINGEEIEIKHFVVASENSINGHLFADDKNIIDSTLPESLGGKTNRIKASELKLIPNKEYERTRQFTRALFENFCRLRKSNELIKKASLGILTTDFYDSNSPYLFICNYIDYLQNKSHWGQRFWRL